MATRLKYYLVREEEELEAKPKNHVIMKEYRDDRKYIERALLLFFKQGYKSVNIFASIKLFERAYSVAKMIKGLVYGLHEIITIKKIEYMQTYEPKEEGLLRVQEKKHRTVVEIVLTKEPTEEEKKSPGYS